MNPQAKAKHSPWYVINALAENEAEILIYGDIGESWMGDTITAAKLVQQLATLKVKTLHVRINSYGGSVSDGLAIFNALRRHGAAIHTWVDGVALSIASLIAMAGDTVHMAKNALLMIHAPWGGAVGNADELREYADVLDKYADAMAASYHEKTKIPVDEIRALLTDGEDHWFTADEALAEKYCDEITESSGDEATPEESTARHRAAARFDFSRFHNIPAAAAAFLPKEQHMKPEDPKGGDPVVTPAPAAPAAPKAETSAEMQARLTSRNTGIRAAFAPFRSQAGMSDLESACLADAGLTLAQAQEKLLAKVGEGVQPLNTTVVSITADAADKRRSAMTQAVLARAGVGKPEQGNPYAEHRLTDIARAALQANGLKTEGWSSEELARAALGLRVRGQQTTSDFPALLENVLHKMILTGFNAQPMTWNRFCKQGDVTDFRDNNRLVPGMICNLDDVAESGEYKDKVIPDADKQKIRVTRKGNIIQVTPEVLVNDDTGAIRDMADGYGRAGARTIERRVYDLLNSGGGLGPVLNDGKTLFHADHNNLAAGADAGAPTVARLYEMWAKMARQTAPGNDQEFLDIQPAVSVSETGLSGEIRVIVGSEYDPDSNNKLQRPNKVRGLVRDVVNSPRVANKLRYYLFADPNVAPVIEVVFLNGQREPRLTQEENFRTGGLAWRVELPFGVAAIDYRGGQYNPGA